MKFLQFLDNDWVRDGIVACPIVLYRQIYERMGPLLRRWRSVALPEKICEERRKPMEKEEIERLTKVEDRAKSNSHRLDKLEPIVNEIHTMSKTMVQLVEEVKHTNETVSGLDEKVDRMDSRVDVMERAPAEDMKSYKRTAATAIISTVAGALATGIVVLIAQFI